MNRNFTCTVFFVEEVDDDGSISVKVFINERLHKFVNRVELLFFRLYIFLEETKLVGILIGIGGTFCSLYFIVQLNESVYFFKGKKVNDRVPSPYFLISVIPVLLLFVLGLLYFRKIEDEIAEFI